MTSKYTLILLTAVLVWVPPMEGFAAQPDFLIPDLVKNNIKRRVDVEENVSISVAFVQGGRSTLLQYGFLSSQKMQPVQPETVYEIGSVTKAMAGLLLADLAVRNTVSLDQAFVTLLPDNVEVPSSIGQKVSLKELAIHRSGLPRLPTNLEIVDPANPYKTYSTEKLYEFLGQYEWTDNYYKKFEYSNLAYGLLGHVIALKQEKSLESVMQKRLFELLNMKSSYMTKENTPKNLAKGHFGPYEVSYWDFNSLQGAGAVKSTSQDMLAFIKALLKPKLTPLSEAIQLSMEPIEESNIPNTKMGLGWFILQGEEGPLIFHNGQTGGFHSFVGINPVRETGVAVLTNSAKDIDDIGLHLLDSNIPIKPVKEAIEVEPKILKEYTGQYVLAPGFEISIELIDGQLTAQATGESAFNIFAETEILFFYRAFNAEIRFKRDADGKVFALDFIFGGQTTEAKKKL